MLIVRLSDKKIVDVNESFINRVRQGQEVTAILDAYPDWTIPAHVITTIPAADRQKATVRVRIGFDEPLSHVIEAGADMFMMPSKFEPCGLNQMYSLKYGTVPIVRRTGGLADSVQMWDPATRTGTGIVFNDFDVPAIRWALHTALDLDHVLGALRETVQVVRGVEHAEVAEDLPALLVLAGRPGEEQLVQHRAAGRGIRFQCRRLAFRERRHLDVHRAALQHLRAEGLRPAERQLSELAGHETDDGVRDVVLLRVLLERRRLHVGPDELQGEIADHLGGRGHLHDVAEDRVGGGVGHGRR